tara:strand:- start:180 stop:461 length:282 start_codon:yes stop_codon:yes gene_type:complete
MKMTLERAEVLALQMLAFIASDKNLLPRFLALTGMDVDGLRVAADETGTMIAVVDFVMFDDLLVTRFAEFAATQPEEVAQVRLALAGPEVDPV